MTLDVLITVLTFQYIIMVVLTFVMFADILGLDSLKVKSFLKHFIVRPLQFFMFQVVCFVLISWVRLKNLLRR